MQAKISSFFKPFSASKSPPVFDDDDDDNGTTSFSDKEGAGIFGGDDEKTASFSVEEPEVVITYKRRVPNPDRYDTVLLPLDFPSFGCRLNSGLGNWAFCFCVSYSSGLCLVAEKR